MLGRGVGAVGAVAVAMLIAWGAPAAQAAPFVYAAAMHPSTGSASVYQFDGAAGALSPLSPSTASLPSLSNPQGVAVHPGGRSVYVAARNRGTVLQFSVAPDGSLTPKVPESVAVPGPMGVAVSPDGRYAYVAASGGGAGQVRQFAVAADGGLLPLTPASVASGTDTFDVAVAPDGHGVYVTNTAAGTVSQYAVGADGTLTPRTPATASAGAAPVGLALSPDGGSAYAVNTDDDTVSQFSVGADGTLTPKDPATVDTTARPYAIAVSRDGRHAYVAGIGASVAQLSVAADGALVPKAPATVEARSASGTPVNLFDVATSPDGRSVYASGSGSVVQFSADEGDGRLSPMTPASRSVFGTASSLAVGPVDIAAPPTVSITRPVDGARYRLGQAVSTAFTCTEGSGGPGIATCLDEDGRPSGRPLDTSTSGDHTFEVTATSAGGKTASRTVAYSVNTFPTAAGQTASTDEDDDVTVALDVLDADGDPLSATITDPPDRGSVSCEGTVCTYSPDPDAHGDDAFAYAVSDGQGGSAAATVGITIRPVNDPPVALAQSLTTDEDTDLPLSPTGTDPDGDELTLDLGRPAHGAVACDDGGCAYVPDTNFHGPDEVTFTVTDEHGETDAATVSITVRPVNDAPVADDRSATVAEDGSTTFAISATDADGDLLSARVSEGPSHGTATCDGLLCTYEPGGDHHGSDAFVVRVDDGHGGTDTATVSVTVTPVNDAPTAQGITVATDEDTAVQLALLASDVDGDALTYAVTGTGPQHGTASCSGALCTYTPAADYHGPDAFTYRVTDPSGASAGASVTITVTSVVDATTLTVPPVLRALSQPLLKLTVPFEARLTRSPGGRPLAGRTITFVAGGQRACSAATDAAGVARCTATLPSLLGVLLGLGYTAVFDGDAVHAGSSGKGALVA